MKVAVLGLGAMGLEMASCLADSFDCVGFDVWETRRELAKERGISVVDTAAEAVQSTDVMVIAVRNAEQLDELLFGDDGIAHLLNESSTIVLTSTIGIDAAIDFSTKLKDIGVGLVDAPVSGGPARASQGDLLIVVGAYPAVYDSAKPVLDALASNLVLVGDEPGKGQAMKTVNQLLCGIHIAASAEAMALAGELGLDQAATLDALMNGAAASFMLGDRGPRSIEAYNGEDPEVKSRLDIFVKDMGIVTSAAKRVGMAVPVAAAAEQLYLQGLANGQGAMDDSSVIKVIQPRRSK